MSRNVVQFKDKDNNIYYVKDANARKEIAEVKDTKADPVYETLTDQAVATFSDGADGMPMGVTIGIEPVQDLHGYDNPWIAGGGKNKSVINTASLVKGTTDEVTALFDTPLPAGSYILTRIFSGTATTVRYELIGQDSSVLANPNIATNETSTITISVPAYSIRIYIGSTQTTGATANITQLMLRDSSVSDASYAPYSNICPITGWTGANVVNTNNLLDTSLYTITTGKYINSEGEISTAQGYCYVNEYIRAENTKYAIRCDKTATQSRGIYAIYYDANKQFIGSDTVVENTSTTGIIQGTFTPPATAKYMRFDIANFTSGTLFLQKGNSIVADESLCDQYEITFPSSAGTVYGGTLTIDKDGSGTLVVDSKKKTYTGAQSESWSSSTSGDIKRYYVTESDMKSVSSGRESVLSNMGVYRAEGNDVGTIFATTSNRIFYIPTQDLSDLTTYTAWLANNNLEIMYPLATPVTYTFTASQIASLLGVNNLWADTGNILQLDYPADTKLYVNKQISASQRLMELIVTANHEDGMKATQAYSSGDLLIVNGTLYKASASIANGATLTVGTNVTATTVASELAALA